MPTKKVMQLNCEKRLLRPDRNRELNVSLSIQLRLVFEKSIQSKI